MDLFDYMLQTKQTAVYPKDMPEGRDDGFLGLMYCAIKLAGEAGEVAEKIAKAARDDGCKITEGRCQQIAMEIGDVFWYLVRICDELYLDPREVLQQNLAKLASRKQRGVLGGDGDNR